VVRTMSDAYEFDVPDGDVAKAITTGTPRITPLPNEPQGEAICYSADGRSLLTASDEPGPTTVLRYTPAAPAASPSPAAPPSPSTVVAQAGKTAVPSELSLSDLTWIVAAAGGLGFILFVWGLVALRLHRRRA
jgi:hypothetical protein